jgi:hypothetical protein
MKQDSPAAGKSSAPANNGASGPPRLSGASRPWELGPGLGQPGLYQR